MEEDFSIEVSYNGKVLAFPARLSAAGYIHKFLVVINGIEVIYEPDEERNYRAILHEPDKALVKDLDRELIALVGVQIGSLHE